MAGITDGYPHVVIGNLVPGTQKYLMAQRAKHALQFHHFRLRTGTGHIFLSFSSINVLSCSRPQMSANGTSQPSPPRNTTEGPPQTVSPSHHAELSPPGFNTKNTVLPNSHSMTEQETF